MEEKTDILVVYGHHPDELFAVEVGKELENLGRDDFRVKEYDGHPESMKHRMETHLYSEFLRIQGHFNRFVKDNPPADYVIDLHDNLPLSDIYRETIEKSDRQERWPSVSIDLRSRYNINEDLKEEIIDYCMSKEYNALFYFFDEIHYLPKSYDKILIEYLPLTFEKEKAISFTLGLVDLLHLKRS